MEVVSPIIAGLDVHERTVVACLRVQEGKRVQRTLRTFGTTTPALLELQRWLVENQCPRVIIESTGVYWKPVFNILEGSVEVILANAHQVKTLPGRKTDMRDAEWLAELGAHGLVKASFIPPEPIRELRELTRYRKSLIRQRTAEVNRIQKILETANIKLGSVASDVLGASGRAMLRALIAGERDAVVLAGLAKGMLRKKMDQLIPSLSGRFLQRHAFLLQQMLDHVEFIDSQIATIDGEVERLCVPFEIALQLLQSTPGVGSRTAQVILAEIGCDMNQFPTEHHLASWAAICPGNNESAGKRRTGKTRNGNPWLRAALLEAAWAASRARGTYLQSQFRHLAYARGKGTKKAIVAVAHSILIAAWHILKNNVPYNDLGPEHLRRTDPEKIKRLLVRKLEALGYRVSLEEKTAA
jgi:transposase